MRGQVLIIVSLLVPRLAAGQPASAQAEALFRQARELLEAGKYEEACSAFDASEKLDPAISTLVNQANCRELNQQFATAWGLFVQAQQKTVTATDPRVVQLHALAVERAAQLEPKLSKLTITVTADHRVSGMEILVGADTIDAGMWGRALPVDRGTYTISVRAPGYESWTTTVTIAAERDAKTVDVPALARGPEIARGSKRSRTVPLIIGASAVALLGGSLGFELAGRSKLRDANRATTEALHDDLYRAANHRHYMAQALAGTGIAAAGVAAWMFWRGGSTESSAIARVHGFEVEPVLTTTSSGLQLTNHF
ncbi:MAG TPA: hypothetical protein VFQ53_28665 [Kofleriaceae bacterium]|nr:hypothetical protein [Kofleriaceae bacterium]